MNDLIADLREYLAGVNEKTSWFCIVDDIGSIIDAYEPAAAGVPPQEKP